MIVVQESTIFMSAVPRSVAGGWDLFAANDSPDPWEELEGARAILQKLLGEADGSSRQQQQPSASMVDRKGR